MCRLSADLENTIGQSTTCPRARRSIRLIMVPLLLHAPISKPTTDRYLFAFVVIGKEPTVSWGSVELTLVFFRFPNIWRADLKNRSCFSVGLGISS